MVVGVVSSRALSIVVFSNYLPMYQVSRPAVHSFIHSLVGGVIAAQACDKLLMGQHAAW